MVFKFVFEKYSKILRLLPVFLVLFILGCNTPTGNVVVEVEIADEFIERSVGLMHRESLGNGKGMCFVFDEPAYKSFWMKNTLIPLDLIFISEEFEVVDIKKDFRPCEEDPCEVYQSRAEAKYVLEVNSGFADENFVRVGSMITYDGTNVYFGQE